jgi:hypothetical protein
VLGSSFSYYLRPGNVDFFGACDGNGVFSLRRLGLCRIEECPMKSRTPFPIGWRHSLIQNSNDTSNGKFTWGRDVVKSEFVKNDDTQYVFPTIDVSPFSCIVYVTLQVQIEPL